MQIFPDQIMDMNKEGLLNELNIEKCVSDEIETPFRSLRLDLIRARHELGRFRKLHKAVYILFEDNMCGWCGKVGLMATG